MHRAENAIGGDGRRSRGASPYQAAGGCTPSAASASAAASCSAAFFVEPLPIPSCSPSISAAQTNRRSCGGPSTSSTSYWTARPVRASASWSSVFESTCPVLAYSIRSSNASTIAGATDVVAVLEVHGRDRRLEQRREHVAAQRDAVRAPGRARPARARRARRRGRASRATAGAALPRDDVRADLREPPLGRLGEPVVERPRDGELEHGVPEELEALVGGRAVRRPRRVREDVVAALGGKGVDQARERLALPLAHLTDARRRSRRPDRRSSASGRPRPGS